MEWPKSGPVIKNGRGLPQQRAQGGWTRVVRQWQMSRRSCRRKTGGTQLQCVPPMGARRIPPSPPQTATGGYSGSYSAQRYKGRFCRSPQPPQARAEVAVHLSTRPQFHCAVPRSGEGSLPHHRFITNSQTTRRCRAGMPHRKLYRLPSRPLRSESRRAGDLHPPGGRLHSGTWAEVVDGA